MNSLILLAVEQAEQSSITTINPGLTFWTIVTFVVLFVVLRFTAWKPMLKVVEEREKSIRDAIEAAKRERAEAEKLLNEQKSAIAEARREAAELMRKNQAEVERAREEMMRKNRKEAEDILHSAKKQIEEEKRRAIAEVKNLAVDLAIDAAKQFVASSLDEKKQRALVEEYIEKLPNKPSVAA